MSIPLDKLYHFIDNLSGDNTLIYRWTPHGSKNLDDLLSLHEFDRFNRLQQLPIVCHDQEPLNFNFTNPDDLNKMLNDMRLFHSLTSQDAKNYVIQQLQNMHAYRIKVGGAWSAYDKTILCHSEKNSAEVEKFKAADFIDVYYWSHALIARDWFRYAKYDTTLYNLQCNFDFDFLIYNRAWQGTREYRIKFAELLLTNDLIDNCNTKFNPHDNGIHYTEHIFSNEKFKVDNPQIEKFFILNESTSSYSADYDNKDYIASGVDVVLETLFDDERFHLTEKTLRPIACGKPFILAATPGSLDYLRSYGFKTFSGLIDESYDTIRDPLDRLLAIVNEMKRISLLSKNEKLHLWKELHSIADFNRKLFFSEEWHSMIVNELHTNLKSAILDAKSYCNGSAWRNLFARFKEERNNPEILSAMGEWLSTNGFSSDLD